MQDQVTTPCPTYTWCKAIYRDHDAHMDVIYTPTSESATKIGAGLVQIDGGEPRIFVHLDDDNDVDEDVYCTIDEAVDLVDALISAISHAREVEQRA